MDDEDRDVQIYLPPDYSAGLSYDEVEHMFASEEEKVEEETETEEEEDDNMTWESQSTVSIEENIQPVDDWLPFVERKVEVPNFVEPNVTSIARAFDFQLITPPPTQVPPTKNSKPARYEWNEEDEVMEEKHDSKFQNFKFEICPNPSKREMSNMVLDYFVHHCIPECVDSIVREHRLVVEPGVLERMAKRGEIKKLIMDGKAEEAVLKLNEISPKIMENRDTYYILHKQALIEKIRNDRLSESMQYAREVLMKDGYFMESKLDEMEKVFALMAFNLKDQTVETPFHVFLTPKHREWTSNRINSAVLEFYGLPRHSKLEMFTKTIAFAKKESYDHHNPLPPMDCQAWATKYFKEPYGFDNIIDMSDSGLGPSDDHF